jgi:hypothetical protein
MFLRPNGLMFRVGAGLAATFVVMRWVNSYGDPSPWSAQSTPLMTLLSFLRASTYPPSPSRRRCARLVRYGRIDFMVGFPPSLLVVPRCYPADYGYHLLQVYGVWVAIVCALYPLCRWFAGVKARNRSRVLSYL